MLASEAKQTKPSSEPVLKQADVRVIPNFAPVAPPRHAVVMGELERAIAGALKSTIHSHGPITQEWIGSASKRIAATILEAAKRERDYLMTTTPTKAKL